jgi:hypothetical protein
MSRRQFAQMRQNYSVSGGCRGGGLATQPSESIRSYLSLFNHDSAFGGFPVDIVAAAGG